MTKNVRWKQRFQNFEKAFLSLKNAVEKKDLNELERTGLILTFNFTFELAWKTLKDFLEAKGIIEKFPRDVLKTSFQNGLIQDGHLWIEMLDKRNELMHVYDEQAAKNLENLMKTKFYPQIDILIKKLQEQYHEKN